MISYAQNFEDVILHRVFKDRKDGFYIDVGAMDPVVESVTKFFYDEGWYGINIEPNEFFYSKLLQERPRDINLNLALGEREETRPWHVFEQYGLSTFNDEYRDRFTEQGFELQERTARVTTLAAICRDYVRREIDFLKIDCEGWEKFVIRGADWDRFRPIVVIVEATEPLSTTPSWSEWEPLLIMEGRYQMVHFDGLNRFYLRREYSDLRHYFDLPPNVFDGFTLHATAKAEQAVQAVQTERGHLAARVAELEERTNSTAAENVQLNESAHAMRACLEAGRTERDHLTARVAELEERTNTKDKENVRLNESIQATRACLEAVRTERDHLTARVAELEEMLQKTRLWVGQLSQDLAACKRRQ